MLIAAPTLWTPRRAALPVARRWWRLLMDKWRFNSAGKFGVTDDGFDPCGRCCGPCESTTNPLDVTLAGLDANRCTPCHHHVAAATAWDVTALAVDATYSVAKTVHGVGINRWYQVFVGPSLHLKQHAWPGACAAVIDEGDCDHMEILVDCDCSDKDANGQPRVVTIDIRFRWNLVPATPNGWFGETPPAAVFHYSRANHGGTYYLGDAVPNFNTDCTIPALNGKSVAINGTATPAAP